MIKERFLQANQDYNNGDFAKAIGQYKSLLNEDENNGILHFNLANAYFKEGQLAPAIFHYRQAQVQLPRDGDVSYNLNYVRGQRVEQVPIAKSWVDYVAISYSESLLILLVVSLLFWAQYVIGRTKLWRPLPILRNILAVVLLASLVLPGYYQFFAPQWGVVKSEKVSVYSGIGKDQVVLFALQQGAEVVVNKVIKSADETWAQIQIGDGNKGWVNTNALLF